MYNKFRVKQLQQWKSIATQKVAGLLRQEVPRDWLVAEWLCNQTANDTAWFQSNWTMTWWVFTWVAEAAWYNKWYATFDWTWDYISFWDDARLELATFSFSCWVNPNSTQNAYANIVDMAHNSSSWTSYWWAFEQNITTNNQYSFAVARWASNWFDTILFTISAATWTHIACYYNDSTKNANVYVNWVAVWAEQTFSSNTWLIYSTMSKYIARWNGNTARDWNWKWCLYRYYNKQLTVKDFQLLYREWIKLLH